MGAGLPLTFTSPFLFATRFVALPVTPILTALTYTASSPHFHSVFLLHTVLLINHVRR